ncbi:MAG TPA: AMP-binding protein [Solirubrobacteraceae bacterium]|nr:AMP-binding protein [Solirubrobacteraceae bacterium]
MCAPDNPLPAFLRWLAEPSDARGVHVFAGGDWEGRSYRQLADAAHGLARRIGGAADTVSAVAVCSQRADEVLVAAGASWLLGAPIHVVATQHAFDSTDEHLALVCQNVALSATDHVVVGRNAGAVADRIANACDPDDRPALHAVDDGAPGAPLTVSVPGGAAVHQFTSGSMGAPKLIRVSSGNLAANLDGEALWLGWRDGVDAWSSWLPLNHDMGLVGGLFLPMAGQSDLWSCSPQQFLRDPWTWLAPLADGRATSTAGPTFAYGYAASRLAAGREASADFSRWRVATIGAELVSSRVLGAFVERFGQRGFSPRAFCPAYGMAECTLAATAVAPGAAVRAAPVVGSVGWSIGAPAPLGDVVTLDLADLGDACGDALIGCGTPIAGFEVRVLDEHGAALPDGRFGEIELRGTSIAQMTTSPVAGPQAVVADAAVRTGDGGVVIDGELFVVGRLGDGLKLRGAFVDCEGLEQRLLRAVGLREGEAALALGQLGEEVHAVLAVRRAAAPGEPPARAIGLLRAVAGPGAQLTLMPVGARGLPRTSSGKPQRRLIWERWIDSRRATVPELAESTPIAAAA